MNESRVPPWEEYVRCSKEIELQFSHPATTSQRSLFLARAARSLCQTARASTCSLQEDAQLHVATVDANGEERPEWNSLAEQLAADCDAGGRVSWQPLKGKAELQDCHWATIALRHQQRWFGAVGIAVADQDRATRGPCIEDSLSLLARQISVHLALEACRGKLVGLVQELGAADIPAGNQLARHAAHEVNNVLHALVLQVAVLEHQLGGEKVEAFDNIRQQTQHAATAVKEWQKVRQRIGSVPGPVDLNAAVEKSMAAAGLAPSALRLELAGDLPKVLATERALEDACTELLKGALASRGQEGSETLIRTLAADTTVSLRIESLGEARLKPSLKLSANLRQIFARLSQHARQGSSVLELSLLAIPAD